MKICTMCGVSKPLTAFNKNSRYREGYYKHCRACHYEVYGRDSHYKRTYGISQQDYNDKMELLGDRCEVCNTPSKEVKHNKWDRLVIDHNHKTGEIRGFLCQPCNMALGSARDNPNILRDLATYLEERGHG